MNRLTLVVVILTILALEVVPSTSTVGDAHIANGGSIDEVNVVITQNIIFDDGLIGSLDFNKFSFHFSSGSLSMSYDNETIVPIQDGNTLYYYIEVK